MPTAQINSAYGAGFPSKTLDLEYLKATKRLKNPLYKLLKDNHKTIEWLADCLPDHREAMKGWSDAIQANFEAICEEYDVDCYSNYVINVPLKSAEVLLLEKRYKEKLPIQLITARTGDNKAGEKLDQLVGRMAKALWT